MGRVVLSRSWSTSASWSVGELHRAVEAGPSGFAAAGLLRRGRSRRVAAPVLLRARNVRCATVRLALLSRLLCLGRYSAGRGGGDQRPACDRLAEACSVDQDDPLTTLCGSPGRLLNISYSVERRRIDAELAVAPMDRDHALAKGPRSCPLRREEAQRWRGARRVGSTRSGQVSSKVAGAPPPATRVSAMFASCRRVSLRSMSLVLDFFIGETVTDGDEGSDDEARQILVVRRQQQVRKSR